MREKERGRGGEKERGGGKEVSPEVIRIYPLHIAEFSFREVMSEDIVGKPRLEVQWKQ